MTIYNRKTANILKNCLYKGHVLLPALCGLLMRFRQKQTEIAQDFYGCQTQNNLQTVHIKHRFRRILFGVISSPFLLAAVIETNLEKVNIKLSKEIKTNIYADNILMTAENKEEANKKFLKSKNIVKKNSNEPTRIQFQS